MNNLKQNKKSCVNLFPLFTNSFVRFLLLKLPDNIMQECLSADSGPMTLVHWDAGNMNSLALIYCQWCMHWSSAMTFCLGTAAFCLGTGQQGITCRQPVMGSQTYPRHTGKLLGHNGNWCEFKCNYMNFTAPQLLCSHRGCSRTQINDSSLWRCVCDRFSS